MSFTSQVKFYPYIEVLLIHFVEYKVCAPFSLKDGWNAVMFAVSNNSIDCLKLLLEKGAEMEVQDEVGDFYKINSFSTYMMIVFMS